MNARLLPLVFVLWLTGCGFHLRGMVEIPCWLTDVAIIYKESTLELNTLLKSEFSRHRIRIAEDPSLAKYWLIIDQFQFQKQLVNVGSSTNPRQYQLILLIDFKLQTKQGEPILDDQRVLATRQLTINNDRILGSNDEERIFRHEMKQDVVIQIMNRLASINHAD